MDNAMPTSRCEILLEEYRVISDMHQHFDNMNLAMMSTIVAGVFVLWGIILKVSVPLPLTVSIEILVFLILSGWIRYMSIHRGIVVRKLTRAQRIEELLNMRQNLIFRDDDPIKRRRHRPGAHLVELLIYVFLVTLGSVVTLCTVLEAAGKAGTMVLGSSQSISLTALGGFVALAPLVGASYWAITCRVEVAQVIPHYRPPESYLLRWLLTEVGGYEDLHSEVATSDRADEDAAWGKKGE